MEEIKLTPEELAAEQAAMKEAKIEEVRAGIITEYGFDEVGDAERIEKMVAKEMESRKALSRAIGQKIKERAAKELLETEKAEAAKKPPVDIINKALDEKLDERFEKRDLESLEYPDELKTEIQKVAKTQGISVKQAVKEPYIVFKIDEYNKNKETDEASASRTNKTGTKVKFSLTEPPDVDVKTPEGLKKYNEWLEWAKTQQ